MTDAAEPSARERWNERYRRVGAETFGRAPSDWLVQQRPRLEASPAGRALDVACGGGRNALFLAEIGFEVDAVDVSDVAVERLRAVAAQRELSVNAVRADLEDAPFPHSTYQVIINFNVLLRSLFAPIQRALAPGGLLVLETWRQEPGRRRHALCADELLRAFTGLEILAHAERREGDEQLREAFVARKPGTAGMEIDE